MSGAAVAQEPGEPLCGDCHTTGRIAHELSSDLLEFEKPFVLCSHLLRADPVAMGLDWIPCPNCLTPSVKKVAQEAFDKEIARRKQWLSQMDEVEKVIGHPSMFMQTKNFLLLYDLPEIKVKRRTVRQHEGLHLYSDRAEELHRQVRELMGMEEGDMIGTLHKLYMFERLRDAKELSPMLVALSIGGGQKVSKIGAPTSIMVSWDDPEKILGDDENRHQFFVHTVSHHIHNDVKEYTYWLFKRYGWVYEGLAYFHEIRQFGSPKVNCSQEQAGTANWKGKSWEANIKKALQAGKEPSAIDVMSRGADQLSDMERQFAWSYIDFLMWKDPNKMPRLLALMKGPQLATRECLEQAYGLSMGQFIDEWSEFVRREYSTRPKKGGQEREPKVPPKPIN